MRHLTQVTLAAGLLTATTSLQAALFLQEDFNFKTSQDLLDTGWDLNKNEFAKETGTDFGIASFPFNPLDFPSRKQSGAGFKDPLTGLRLFGPPGADGVSSARTDEEGAGYLLSDSDAAGGSDDLGSKSEFYAITAPFSTKGGGAVWFHADAAWESNNNGECVVDFSVSVDGGNTWLPFYQSAEPQRPIKSYSFYSKGLALDPDFHYDGSEVMGGWPLLGGGSTTKTWNGLHGRVHFALPAEASGKDEVKVRIRFYEPADAWWIAIDNLVIDDVPPPQGSSVILSEGFDSGIPGTWKKSTSGLNNWGTEPARDQDGNFYRNFTYKDADGVDVIQRVNIDLIHEAQHRIETGTNITMEALLKLDNKSFTDYPELANTNPSEGKLDGRFIMALAGQNYAIRSDSFDPTEINDLDTPTMDLSDATGVFLKFDSEALAYSASTFYEVQVSVDGGANFERVFTYMSALMDLGEAASFTRHYIELPQAAGQKQVIVRFHAAGGDSSARGFWVIDNVSVTANKAGGAPIVLNATAGAAGKVNLSWTGGQGPFTLQTKSTIDGTWTTAGTSATRSITVDAGGSAGFYRVIE